MKLRQQHRLMTEMEMEVLTEAMALMEMAEPMVTAEQTAMVALTEMVVQTVMVETAHKS